MPHKHHNSHTGALVLLAVLGVAWGILSERGAAAQQQEYDRLGSAHELVDGEIPRSLHAAGLRLQRRISSRFGVSLPLNNILPGLAFQRSMLGRRVSMEFVNPERETLGVFAAGIQEHPDWLRANVELSGLRYTIDAGAVAASIREWLPPTIPGATDATLLSIAEEDNLVKAVTDGVAKSGYVVEPENIAEAVATSLLHGVAAEQYRLQRAHGRIANATGTDVGDLTLIATGQSNFAGSGVGRKANVRKGISQHLHNTVIREGEEFSMNSIFENVPISEWELALGIFNGGDLRPIPGGGICQVATTLYRAVLNAGFPVTKRNSHSLYVVYYEKYGVGIDATIYPGSTQDLKFRNDTGHPLLVQAYTDGDEATVNIYGTDDGRTVRLTGPYFAATAPEDVRVNGRKVRSNEIVWMQEIERPDGRTEGHEIVSKYKTIPNSVIKKFLNSVATTTVRLHAASADPPDQRAGTTEDSETPHHGEIDLRAIVVPKPLAVQ